MIFNIKVIKSSSKFQGEKFKIGVYKRSRLVEDLGTFSVSSNGNSLIYINFDKLEYYLSIGLDVACDSTLFPFGVLSELISFHTTNIK